MWSTGGRASSPDTTTRLRPLQATAPFPAGRSTASVPVSTTPPSAAAQLTRSRGTGQRSAAGYGTRPPKRALWPGASTTLPHRPAQSSAAGRLTPRRGPHPLWREGSTTKPPPTTRQSAAGSSTRRRRATMRPCRGTHNTASNTSATVSGAVQHGVGGIVHGRRRSVEHRVGHGRDGGRRPGMHRIGDGRDGDGPGGEGRPRVDGGDGWREVRRQW